MVDGDTERTEIECALNCIKMVRAFGVSPSQENWREILAMMEPFRDQAFLDGASDRFASDRVLSLVLAVIGDAHRELGQPLFAAAAYGRAVPLQAFMGFCDFYAPMVLQHNLDSHYEHALTALVESKHYRQRSRLTLRVVSHVVCFCQSPKTYAQYLRNQCKHAEWRRQLTHRLSGADVNQA